MAVQVGLIGFDETNSPIMNTYGDVLLFKTREDALSCGAVSCKRVYKAKMPRKRKTSSPGDSHEVGGVL